MNTKKEVTPSDMHSVLSNITPEDNAKGGPVYIVGDFYLDDSERLFVMRRNNTFDLRYESGETSSVLAVFKDQESAELFVNLMILVTPEETSVDFENDHPELF
jgi:hypothetical protein